MGAVAGNPGRYLVALGKKIIHSVVAWSSMQEDLKGLLQAGEVRRRPWERIVVHEIGSDKFVQDTDSPSVHCCRVATDEVLVCLNDGTSLSYGSCDRAAATI
jgi:hypothetical protein